LLVYVLAPHDAAAGKHTSVLISKQTFQDLDPIAVLEKCLARYRKEVQGYTAIMYKQERIGGQLQKEEEIKVAFKENPHSVSFEWLKGARSAERALYVEGANNGKLLARPNGFLARKIAGEVVSRDVDGSDAHKAGRYTLKQFGMKKGTERSLATLKRLRAKKQLKVEYLGIHRAPPKAGNRLCYKFHATYTEPVDDGVTDLTIYIDKETWLQVGSQLKGKDGVTIGDYFFRDIKLNPEFPEDQFKRKALIP